MGLRSRGLPAVGPPLVIDKLVSLSYGGSRHSSRPRGEAAMRKALFFVALVVSVVAAGTVAPAPTPAGAEAPDLASGFGITVTGHRWISARTFEVDVSTPLVHPGAVNGPHRVRVTLPGDYLQRPTTRWPVLYLLHGGAGGSSAQWTTGGGAVEAITAGRPVITVMAD